MEGDSLIALLQDNDAVHHAKVENHFIFILLPKLLWCVGLESDRSDVSWGVGWGWGAYPNLGTAASRGAVSRRYLKTP